MSSKQKEKIDGIVTRGTTLQDEKGDTADPTIKQ
jgi:hypothetical protein